MHPKREPVGVRIRNSLRQLWVILPTVIKGASGPVIAIALFQYAPFADHFPTFGYLIAIVAILGMPIMPRIKFLQTLLLDLISIGIATAVSLLACYCCIQARSNTSAPSPPGPHGEIEYNSSASVISGIWLFFSILVANAMRFAHHQLHLPMILYAIYANIVGTYAPIFVTMEESIGFIETLFEAFLAGLGIATVVHFAYPRNSRQTTLKQCQGFSKLAQKILNQQREFFAAVKAPNTSDNQLHPNVADLSEDESAAATSLRATLTPMTNLLSQLRSDLPFAKREIAFGKLEANDFETIFRHFHRMMQPLLGIDFIAEMFISDAKDTSKKYQTQIEQGISVAKHATNSTTPGERELWRTGIYALHQPSCELLNDISKSLSHVMITYGVFEKPSNAASDEPMSSRADSPHVPQPGSAEFPSHFESRLGQFMNVKREILEELYQKSDEVSKSSPVDIPNGHGWIEPRMVSQKTPNLHSLYPVYYIDFLLSSMAKCALDFVKMADARSSSGDLRHSRIVWQGKSRFAKWIKSLFKADLQPGGLGLDGDDFNYSSHRAGASDNERQRSKTIATSGSLAQIGAIFQTTLSIFGRAEVVYGFRAACATLSIGVVDYIYQTQLFFIQERLVWSMIMIAISMTMTTGSGVFGFLYRVLGSLFATCTSLIIWYVSGARGIPGAVLPLLWIVCLGEVYVMITKPRFSIAVIITLITQVLILGYELGVDKIGVKLISEDGSRYYPIYELAPYRLATVVGGLAVAFIWTYFPFPVTAQTALRKQLGDAMFVLSKYHATVHSMIGLKISGSIKSHSPEKSSSLEGYAKSNRKIRNDILVLVSQLHQHSAFVSYEMKFGSRFPRDKYLRLITRLVRIMSYVSLLELSTTRYCQIVENRTTDQDLESLRHAFGDMDVSADQVTNYLVLISTSLLNASPLPPNQSFKKPSEFTEYIQRVCEKISSAGKGFSQDFAAFTAVAVISRFFDGEMEQLLDEARSLLGEVDFSVATGV